MYIVSRRGVYFAKCLIDKYIIVDKITGAILHLITNIHS